MDQINIQRFLVSKFSIQIPKIYIYIYIYIRTEILYVAKQTKFKRN